jgi:hypothetical protein
VKKEAAPAKEDDKSGEVSQDEAADDKDAPATAAKKRKNKKSKRKAKAPALDLTA